LGKISKEHLYISPVIPSSQGAFLSPMLATAFLISSTVKSLSSSVSTGYGDRILTCLWKSESSLWLSSGAKCSSVCFKVSCRSAVSDPSGFISV